MEPNRIMTRIAIPIEIPVTQLSLDFLFEIFCRFSAVLVVVVGPAVVLYSSFKGSENEKTEFYIAENTLRLNKVVTKSA